MSTVDEQIARARRTMARIADQYADQERVRRWLNGAFLGLTLTVMGIVAAVYPTIIPINSDTVKRFGIVIVGIGPLLIIYSGLQIFLDGTLSELTSARAAAHRTTVNDSGAPPERQVSEDTVEPPAAPARSIRPRHVQTATNMRLRLRKEIDSQGRKAQTNLSMGVITALCSIGFLCWLAWNTSDLPAWVLSPNQSPSNLLSEFAVRSFWGAFVAKVALSFTTSIFSFFFLSTYRRNLGEIKYFQNELTNVELKLFALFMCEDKSYDKTAEKLLVALSATERNFVLKKGETTVEVKSREIDAADTNSLAQMLATAIAPMMKRDERVPR